MKHIIAVIISSLIIVSVQAQTTIDETTRKKIDGLAQFAYTASDALYNSYSLAVECIENKIEGDFVECGVAFGAQIAAMAYACQNLYDTKKRIHLFDSFEGIPLAGPKDTQQPGVGDIEHCVDVDSLDDLLISSNLIYPQMGQAACCSVQRVQELMKYWGVISWRLIYHKGWFQHVLPVDADTIKSISLLRLDGDLYESTKICLDYLYPKVSKGGYVIIDDYNALTGCKRAVDEYLAEHNLHPTIHTLTGGNRPIYWQVQ